MTDLSGSREAACTGKHAFFSPQRAYSVAERRAPKRPSQVYRCPYCRFWHIGTPQGAPNKR